MNIEFSEHYDLEDDIYYVTFKTGEPSLVMEIDDVLLVEIGIFTNMPTGFRILNFKKHRVGKVHFVRKEVEKVMKSARHHFNSISEDRSNRFGDSIQRLLGK